MKGDLTMNTMINPELPEATRAELLEQIERGLKRIAELEQETDGKNTVLAMANESLQSYKAETRNLRDSVQALVFEHIDDKEDLFDDIVELFDIELTKTVTFQYTVSIEVQATVPYTMDDDEIIDELTNANLDYSHWGNGDVVIEDFSFGNMEQE
jgi:hypothetical protein